MQILTESPLVVGLISAILGGTVTLVPWLHEKRKNKEIASDNFGLTFLFTPIAMRKISFNSKNPNLVDVLIHGGTFVTADCWITFNRGGKEQRLVRAIRDGVFEAKVYNLVPDATYQFRTEAMYKGRVVAGPVSQISIPATYTEVQKAELKKDPNYVHAI
jgi:uncharacterized membrane protein